jgi:hypothetical protein
VGPGRAIGKRCWEWRGRRPPCVAGAGPGRGGRGALLGGAALMAGAHGRAGHGRGRARPGQAVGGRYLVGQGVAKAGRASGRCALRGGAWLPTHSRGKAGPSQGRAGRGRPGAAEVESRWPVRGEQGAGVAGVSCVGSREPGRKRVGRAGKNKKRAGFTNWVWAEEHKDPSYVPQLSDVVEKHKSLCYSEI